MQKGVIVEMAKFCVQLSAQFPRWGSLQSLKQQNVDTEVFQSYK